MVNDWRQFAECAGADPALFYPPRGMGGPDTVQANDGGGAAHRCRAHMVEGLDHVLELAWEEHDPNVTERELAPGETDYVVLAPQLPPGTHEIVIQIYADNLIRPVVKRYKLMLRPNDFSIIEDA